jgi:hypothetical protein
MEVRAHDMHSGGGLIATFITMAVTYVAGLLVDFGSRLGEVWAHVTPGQAALAIGLLTYVTHNGPRFYRGLANLGRRLIALRGLRP